MLKINVAHYVRVNGYSHYVSRSYGSVINQLKMITGKYVSFVIILVVEDTGLSCP